MVEITNSMLVDACKYPIVKTTVPFVGSLAIDIPKTAAAWCLVLTRREAQAKNKFCQGAHNVLGNPSCWEAPRSFQWLCW